MKKKRWKSESEVPMNRQPWTDDEQKLFEKLSETLPDKEIAETLGRTVASIQMHRHRTRKD